MINEISKKLGLPILALAGVMMLVGAPEANAQVALGTHRYAYPYAYDPHYYQFYYPYSYPYDYGYTYPYYYGGRFFGGSDHHDRDDRGRFGRGFGSGFRGNAFRGGGGFHGGGGGFHGGGVGRR